MYVFREYLTRETENARFRVAPCFAAQSGFSAGFLKKFLMREAVFEGYLRQKESPVGVEDDEDPVPSNLDRLGRDRFQRRKQRDFNAHVFEVICFHGSESRIFHRGAGGAANDRFSQWLAGFRYSNAALQLPAHVKGNEYTAALRENSIARNEIWKFPSRNGIHHGIAG